MARRDPATTACFTTSAAAGARRPTSLTGDSDSTDPIRRPGSLVGTLHYCRPSKSAALRDLVTRALAKNLYERPQTAAEMMAALMQIKIDMLVEQRAAV